MPDDVEVAAPNAAASGASGRLTERQIRARDLEFRSFAVMAFEVLLGLTGAWFFVWPVALPLLGGLGLACAITAWRIADRRPRFVAPVLTAIHAAPFAFALYFFAKKSGGF